MGEQRRSRAYDDEGSDYVRKCHSDDHIDPRYGQIVLVHAFFDRGRLHIYLHERRDRRADQGHYREQISGIGTEARMDESLSDLCPIGLTYESGDDIAEKHAATSTKILAPRVSASL